MYSGDPDLDVDEQLTVLADEDCRRVVYYFRRRPVETATLEELGRFVRERTDGDAGRAQVQLHHAVLPKLAEAGLLDYDPRHNEVQYRGRPSVDAWLRRVVEREE